MLPLVVLVAGAVSGADSGVVEGQSAIRANLAKQHRDVSV